MIIGDKIYRWAVALMLLTAIFTPREAGAQHTLALSGGTGVSFARFYPTEESPMLWGSENFGLSWRYYSERPRFVGAVGLDLEYFERGYKYGWRVKSIDFDKNGKEIRYYDYYTRRVNSVMLPFVWQPHFYLAKNHLRIYLEAAIVFSYNISSSYEYDNDYYPPGKYEWKVPRDNRFGYGLAGGLGFSVLLGQVEFGLRARYNFGYSDILKNRNKYYSNSTDGRENPFYYTPLRSPMDNINVSFVIGWRFGKAGFKEWDVAREKRMKSSKGFNFSSATNSAASNSGGAANRGAASGARGGNMGGNMGGLRR